MEIWKKAFFKVIALLLLHNFTFASDHSLLYVHIGESIPSHVFTTLKQARYMNESCDIYFLSNQKAIQNLDDRNKDQLEKDSISIIDVNQIPMTKEHKEFRRTHRLNSSLNNFWIYTTERFFFIHDFMEHMDLQKVVHMENDTMLYMDLDEVVPQLEELNIRLAAPFQSLYCCIPCLVYIQDSKSLEALVHHIILENKSQGQCDMLTLASFFRKNGDDFMFTLPVLMSEYPLLFKKRTSVFPLDNQTSLEFLTRNKEAFPGIIFDAIALGVYVNGNDRRYSPKSGPGQIHRRTLFDPSHFSYHWGEDSKGRACPYLTFQGEEHRIVNLHFHSKEIDEYTSYEDTRLPFPTEARE